MPVPLTIGLTGGIGSGKSTVGQMLVELGAHLVDTDAIARALTLPGGAAIPEIERHFGPELIDAQGAMHRDRMRELAFTDPLAMKRLEGILHPLIGQHADAHARLALPGQTVVFDVPLLVESRHWRARVDAVLVVDCDTETQIARVMARNGWAREAVEAVIRQQATRAQRLAAADAVVFNGAGNTLLQLERDVRALATSFGL